jgi:hypothetical protein
MLYATEQNTQLSHKQNLDESNKNNGKKRGSWSGLQLRIVCMLFPALMGMLFLSLRQIEDADWTGEKAARRRKTIHLTRQHTRLTTLYSMTDNINL